VHTDGRRLSARGETEAACLSCGWARPRVKSGNRVLCSLSTISCWRCTVHYSMCPRRPTAI